MQLRLRPAGHPLLDTPWAMRDEGKERYRPSLESTVTRKGRSSPTTALAGDATRLAGRRRFSGLPCSLRPPMGKPETEWERYRKLVVAGSNPAMVPRDHVAQSVEQQSTALASTCSGAPSKRTTRRRRAPRRVPALRNVGSSGVAPRRRVRSRRTEDGRRKRARRPVTRESRNERWLASAALTRGEARTVEQLLSGKKVTRMPATCPPRRAEGERR